MAETKLGTAVVPIRATTDELDKDLADAKGKVEKSATGISGALGKIKWATVGAGAAALTGTLADLAREGAADEASLEAVRVAVENAGGAWDDAAGPLDAYMLKMRDLAAIDDGELKPALASLVAVTGDVNKSMELSSLAADIAKGKNMSLASASELVGKVAQGNVSMLTRYGIILDENATAEEALAELQKRFAGQAEAYGKTNAGAMEIMSLKIGDFREQLGQTMGPAMSVIGMLPGLSAGFSLAGGAVGGLLPLLGGLRVALLTSVIPAIGATIVALAPILIPIAAVSAAVALLALAWSNNWGDIQGKTAAAVGFLRDQLNRLIGFFNGVITAWNNLEFSIPGFGVTMPSVEIAGQTVGGGYLGWGGLNVSTPNLPTIPTLDAGAVVTQPTLAALAMNSRPEAVIPLDRAGAFRGVTINGPLIGEVHVHDEADEDRLARKLWSMLTSDRDTVLSGGVA